MKWLTVLLAGLFAVLQYVLWFGDGGLRDLRDLDTRVTAQEQENRQLHDRNQELAAEVADLKGGMEAVEARARLELGMIKNGEIFYQVIQSSPASPDRPDPADER